MEQNYYLIIPAPVFNDKDLSDKEKLLMGLINSLLNEDGYCFASNTYLAEKMKTTAETISRRLNKLKAKEYIEIVYLKKGNIVTNRKIYPIPPLTKTSTTDDENINGTVDENVKESNKVISNKVLIKEKEINKEKEKYFEDEDLNTKYEEYLQMRIEKKCKATPTTIKSQIKKLSQYNKETALQMLQNSIDNGWRGIFEIKNGTSIKEIEKPFWEEKEIKTSSSGSKEIDEILKIFN